MKIKFFVVFFICILTPHLFGLIGTAAAQNRVPHEVIVRYKDGARAAASLYNRQALGAVTSTRLRGIPAEVIKLPGQLTIESAISMLQSDPDVKWAEPNYLRHALSITPDDIFFDKLWSLNNTGQTVNLTQGSFNADIDATEAWDITTGSQDLIIAVIDSGMDYRHPDLKDNLWTNPGEIAGNGIDDDGNGYVDDIHGWNFISNNNDIMDSNNHGTHVSGIISARGNNTIGISGVCWKASIMVLKFLDSYGSGSTSGEADAIDYAISKGAKIINASFGDPAKSDMESEAISRALAKGILFITAAGNEGVDTDTTPEYPASLTQDNIVSVAASDKDDTLPSWSNYGKTSVDVSAPGVDIYSTVPDASSIMDDGFESGTSGWTLEGNWDRILNTQLAGNAYSGNYSLTDSPSGDYNANEDYSAISPVIDLSGKSRAKIQFYLKGNSESGKDLLYLETATASSGPWTNNTVKAVDYIGNQYTFKTGISGNHSSWLKATAYPTALTNQPTAYFRFRLNTDGINNFDGWYIDEISLTASDGSYSGQESLYYDFIDGTSAATPFVSGLAGLIWSKFPDLSYSQVKDLIIQGVDKKSSFTGKNVSGGRINAFNSLQLASGSVPEPPQTPTTGGGSGSSGFCFIGIMAE